MINLSKLSSAIATGAVLASVLAPGAFASTVDISGNGAFSQNKVSLNQSSSQTLLQSNDSRVTNDVSVSNNTGGNSSSFNTGGNSSITTGNAYSNVDITNGGNTNIATMPSCGCSNSGSDVYIQGNGAFSNNTARLNSYTNSFLSQNNSSNFNNRVNVRNTTGNNSSSFNTGSGGNFWNPSWSQNDWKNWFMQQHPNMNWDQNQFNNWFMNMRNNGSSQITTGDAASSVSIQNNGSQNYLH